MKAVIGEGCMGRGFSVKPDNVRDFINAFLDEQEKLYGDLDDFLYNLVDIYGINTYSADEACEQCGDYYNEYTLEIKG
jgi:hypothetical protein